MVASEGEGRVTSWGTMPDTRPRRHNWPVGKKARLAFIEFTGGITIRGAHCTHGKSLTVLTGSPEVEREDPDMLTRSSWWGHSHVLHPFPDLLSWENEV